MNEVEKYYLYRHTYVESGLPFYIGIGKIDFNKNTIKGQYHRAYNKWNRSRLWLNKVKNKKFEVEIIFESNDLKNLKVRKPGIRVLKRLELEKGIENES